MTHQGVEEARQTVGGGIFSGSKGFNRLRLSGRCSVPCWNLCVVRWLAHFFVEHGPWNMEHKFFGWLAFFKQYLQDY